MRKRNGRFIDQHIKIDLPYKGYVVSSLAASTILIAAILLLKNYLPPQIPLYYGLAVGESQLAPWWGLVIPSSLSLFILFLNVSLSFLVKNDFLRQVLITSSVLVTFFSLVTTVKIILLVSSF